MGKVNTSGTYVHVDTTGNGTNDTAVAPGDEFPKGDYLDRLDPELYADNGDDEETVVAGPGQRPGEAEAAADRLDAANVEWRAVTVAELRDKLGDQADPGDRKDALIAKAEAANLTPGDFKEE